MNTIDIVELHLLSEDSYSNEIESLELFLKENRLKNILTNKLTSTEPAEWSAQGEEYSMLQLILSPLVTVAGIKGVFDILKNYFELKKKESPSKSETIKLQNEQKKISFVYTKADGSKLELEFSSFDEAERLKFQEWVDIFFDLRKQNQDAN